MSQAASPGVQNIPLPFSFFSLLPKRIELSIYNYPSQKSGFSFCPGVKIIEILSQHISVAGA
jgi:hypothetical protein